MVLNPKAAEPTDKKAKRPVMNPSDASGEAGAEEEDMHGGEEEDMHGGEEEDMHAMTPGEEEYEYEMEGDAEEEEMETGLKRQRRCLPVLRYERASWKTLLWRRTLRRVQREGIDRF